MIDGERLMLLHYGMTTMKHRTSFALDELTARRLKTLASRWNVSQAEVVRRSVASAERASDPVATDPVAQLRRLHESDGGMDPERARQWISEIREDRKHWRLS